MPSNLPSDLIHKVCSVIQDTGFPGSADDYTLKYYRKPFEELTVCEAEMIIRVLEDKKGCLVNEPNEVDF